MSIQKCHLKEYLVPLSHFSPFCSSQLTPWNVDTMSKDGFEKTVINKYSEKPESEMTDEELEEKHVSISAIFINVPTTWDKQGSC